MSRMHDGRVAMLSGTETITNKRGSTALSSFAYNFDSMRRKISDVETVTDAGEGLTSSATFT